jgi:hypothetical protein
VDSVKSFLSQLERANLFLNNDRIDLIGNSFIVKMDKFPKEGPIGKAIVYFIVSKLNYIYENFLVQANEKRKSKFV